LPIHWNISSPSDVIDESCPDYNLRRTFEFEGLLFDILARFVNLPLEDVDREIGSALNQLCLLLGVERAGLWRNGQDANSFVLTHYALSASYPLAAAGSGENRLPNDKGFIGSVEPNVISIGTELKTCFPWITAHVKGGEKCVFGRIKDLPEDAAQDRKALPRLGTQALVFIPFLVRGDVLGAMSFEMLSEEKQWPEPFLKRLELVAGVFAQASARKLSEEALTRSFAEIEELKERLEAKTDYLRPEIKISPAHNRIIGRSRKFRRVLQQGEQVAQADCAVLITGETGTGKELIAQEIHHHSARRDRAMVLVNCAALPSTLMESELFGRERGAYTGALTSQIGRFEMAHGSTIFLDEVAELPMEAQAKLLRVLQQGEFQRLGNPKTHKVDVRVIAATNRDLPEEVRQGRFREDLYYRLQVFPITMPPLRERVEDIPLLVCAFVEEFAARMGKKITKIPRKSMEMFQVHSWPGNIRELRNEIERSVILTTGDTLQTTPFGESPAGDAQEIAQGKREHISITLKSVRWRAKGLQRAGARADLKSATLYSAPEKGEIPHPRQKDQLGS
jgi:transcriptional regulator with GAF, ATPase, and Fis domain